jgi:hypothetical protein
MFRKYAAAILPALIVLFGALQTALADNVVDQVEAGQLLALVAGLITTYFVPLLSGRRAGLLKTGAAVLAAIATLILPLIFGFTWQALVIVALAALNAIATEIGVQSRVEVEDITNNGAGTLGRGAPVDV